METQEPLQQQLHSLEELQTIVKTMKALSAASIRQYDQAVNAVSGYYKTVERGLGVVLRDMESTESTTKGSHGDGKQGHLGAVVFGSDHGLCGRFNEEITEYAVDHLVSIAPDRNRRSVLAVGARAAAGLEHGGQPVETGFLLPGSAGEITETVQQVLLKIDEWQIQSNVHRISLFYNRHSGGKGYQPTTAELLPVDLQSFDRLREEGWPSRSLPTFSMGREILLSRLLHQFLFVSVFRACAESQASEHSSRLAAMQSAERNLDERLEDVTMTFRSARQNAITSELLDVVAGFEAITAGPA